MLIRQDFIRQSLETHLFFARIMKEHLFFLQIGFTPRDSRFARRAEDLRLGFDDLLADVVSLSDRVVNNDVLQSGEVFTQYTLEAEKVSEFFTSVPIRTKTTEAEKCLEGGSVRQNVNPQLEREVAEINHRAICLLNDIIQFKETILSEVLACRMFTVNYPLLLDHILREARFYLCLIKRLQSREVVNIRREAYEQEVFWNRIMAEHSKFIRGFLDPTEEALFKAANNFGNQFDRLTCEAKEAMDRGSGPALSRVTEESLQATKEIRDFKAQGTEGILDCNIKSIIIPLLADHTLREANHYLRLLKIFRQ